MYIHASWQRAIKGKSVGGLDGKNDEETRSDTACGQVGGGGGDDDDATRYAYTYTRREAQRRARKKASRGAELRAGEKTLKLFFRVYARDINSDAPGRYFDELYFQSLVSMGKLARATTYISA